MDDDGRVLDAAVQRLYSAFAARPRRGQLIFCDHCVAPDEAGALAGTPLRDLDGDLLGRFAVNACAWTWGEPDDLWYYLPRILELLAVGALSGLDIDGLFRCAGYQWREWPQDQQDAIARYLTALWGAFVAGDLPVAGPKASDILDAAGELGIPLRLEASDSRSPKPGPSKLKRYYPRRIPKSARVALRRVHHWY